MKQLAQGNTAGRQQSQNAGPRPSSRGPQGHAQALQGRACLLADGSLRASLRIHGTQVLYRRESTLSQAGSGRQEHGYFGKAT